jgi:hypothetical protein
MSRDFRIEMISTDPRSEHRFVIWQQGINEHEVAREANEFYLPFGFEVDRSRVTEVINNG